MSMVAGVHVLLIAVCAWFLFALRRANSDQLKQGKEHKDKQMESLATKKPFGKYTYPITFIVLSIVLVINAVQLIYDLI